MTSSASSRSNTSRSFSASCRIRSDDCFRRSVTVALRSRGGSNVDDEGERTGLVKRIPLGPASGDAGSESAASEPTASADSRAWASG